MALARRAMAASVVAKNGGGGRRRRWINPARGVRLFPLLSSKARMAAPPFTWPPVIPHFSMATGRAGMEGASAPAAGARMLPPHFPRAQPFLCPAHERFLAAPGFFFFFPWREMTLTGPRKTGSCQLRVSLVAEEVGGSTEEPEEEGGGVRGDWTEPWWQDGEPHGGCYPGGAGMLRRPVEGVGWGREEDPGGRGVGTGGPRLVEGAARPDVAPSPQRPEGVRGGPGGRTRSRDRLRQSVWPHVSSLLVLPGLLGVAGLGAEREVAVALAATPDGDPERGLLVSCGRCGPIERCRGDRLEPAEMRGVVRRALAYPVCIRPLGPSPPIDCCPYDFSVQTRPCNPIFEGTLCSLKLGGGLLFVLMKVKVKAPHWLLGTRCVFHRLSLCRQPFKKVA
jgi:hypothetical protein